MLAAILRYDPESFSGYSDRARVHEIISKRAKVLGVSRSSREVLGNHR